MRHTPAVAVPRPSSRVLVVDLTGRVLMLGIVLAARSRTIWILPGGGAEPGEDPCQTAQRELSEETGLAVTPAELGQPVAHTSGCWTSTEGVEYFTDQTFFVVHVDKFEPDSSGFTELEREVVSEFRWWSADEMDATDEVVYPDGLSALVQRVASGDIPVPPIELIWSTP